MTKSDIKRLNDGINAILTTTEKVLEVVPILFDSRARNEEEKNLYNNIVQSLPDLSKDIAFISELTFSESIDGKFNCFLPSIRDIEDEQVRFLHNMQICTLIKTSKDLSY